jgi:hypothetical protein
MSEAETELRLRKRRAYYSGADITGFIERHAQDQSPKPVGDSLIFLANMRSRSMIDIASSRASFARSRCVQIDEISILAVRVTTIERERSDDVDEAPIGHL